jgi:iron complex outermembrane receptor protein
VLTVTAPRTAKTLDDVPAAVTVLDADAIQLGQQQLSLDEALRRVPGVFLQDRSNFAQDLRIAIRGFGSRSSFGVRGIRIFVDGIPATLPDGQTQLDSIDLGSTQRIEVLRGPASSLYGASAGGVILIESERGTTPPRSEARVAFGDYGYRRYQSKAGGGVGPVTAFASLSRLEQGGYRDHARTENVMLNGNLRVRIDDSSDFGVALNVVHAPVADDPGGLTAAEVASDRRQAAPNNRRFDAGESVDQQQLGLVYRKAFGDHHAVEAAQYTGWRQFDARLPFGSGGRVDLDRFFSGGGLRYVYTDEIFGRDNRLLLGVDVEAQRDVRKRFDNDLGRRGSLRFDQDENVTAVGVYLQEELRLLETLELTAGVRYDRVAFDVDDGFPGDGNDGGHLDFDEVSPRAGLLWSPHPAFHVFANVATAFETPTTTELADPSGAGGFNSDLDAQTALGGELGVKGVVLGLLRYEAVGFLIDVDDELVPFEVPAMPGRSFFENAGRSRRSGFELAVTAQPCAGLTASLAYTFSHFRFERFRTAAGDFAGNDLPGVPRNQLWGEIAYEHPWGFYGSWEVVYADGVYADNANSVKSDSHVVANLRAGWRGEFGGWEVGPFLGLNNLFGEKYSDNVRLNAASGRSFEPAPVFNVYGGISVGYRFGGP